MRSAETAGAYFCFESSTMPGFGPPLHTHDYRELFYVLEGSYEFTLQRGDRIETIIGTVGTAIAVPPRHLLVGSIVWMRELMGGGGCFLSVEHSIAPSGDKNYALDLARMMTGPLPRLPA